MNKHKKYYENNKEMLRAKAQARRAANPDYVSKNRAETCRKYYEKNRSECAIRNKAVRDANPERGALYARNRRARKVAAGGTHTIVDVDNIRRLQNGRCAYCPSRLTSENEHIDHIVSLKKGGSNSRKNLQLTCRSCNLAKAARDPEDFARMTGRLI